MEKAYQRFRLIAKWEGYSYLALLGIAMPLKYAADLPMAVTIIGSIHGFLFVAMGILALDVRQKAKHSFLWVLTAFIASIVPFGTFYWDKKWEKEQVKMSQIKG
jgi:integral membrane protein